MKVLITGGAGFIGRWLVRSFLSRRDRVWVLDDFSSGSPANLAAFFQDRCLKDVIRCDIRQRKRLMRCVHNIRPDLCCHLAAKVSVQASLEHPQDAFEVNVMGTYNLLEALRPIRSRLLVVGTCLVYKAQMGKPISETDPTEPRSPYAASKLAAEELALGYARGYRWEVKIARPFNTYGPFQRADAEGGVVAIFLKRKLEGLPLCIFGDGRQTRDFLYVEDCVDFLTRLAVSSKGRGQVINAGTGKEISIRRLARMIAPSGQIRLVPHHHPEAEIRRLRCNPSRAYRWLGWRPSTDLAEGLKRTEQWLCENGKRS
jgi:UDP-glucose 4-epimerase